MMISRRWFVLGTAAVVAAPAVAKMEAIIGHPVSRGILDPRLGDRWIEDICFSCMASGEELRSRNFCEDPVQFTAFRGNDSVFHIMINPRASFRWVAVPGAEIFLPNKQILRIDVEPAHTHVALNLISSIDPYEAVYPPKRQRKFSESFHWKDGDTTLSSVAALDYRDQVVLETST